MKIYNEKMEQLEKPDLSAGWLEERVHTIHHAATKAVEEVWHHEVIAEYPNGGRDVRRVIDRPGVEGKDAWEEHVEIQIYHPYTPQELADRAQKPTLEERMGKLEERMELLSGRMEEALKQWENMKAAGGAQ